MNIGKFMTRLMFALTLLGLSQMNSGYVEILEYILIGIMLLDGLILLFEKQISRNWWKAVVKQAEEIDITNIAWGLGLMMASIKFVDVVGVWASIAMLIAGALFSGVGIGKLLGVGTAKIINSNAKAGIVIGIVYIIAGVIYAIMTWDSVLANPSVNTLTPAFVVVMGVIQIYFGLMRLKNKRKSSSS